MEMEENSYGMMDLHYAMVMLGGGEITFGSDSTMAMGMGMGTGTAASSLSGDSGGGGSGLEMESGGRWPKEETLALLEIRTRLDSKFKEANHKGHLWDEVSRIMCAEHGYKRSGKKCSEKFENLYKYYRKIKDGKVGRQDKIQNYRFFHQLEAISCGSSTNTTSNTNPISVTNAISRPSPPFVEDDNHLKKRMMGKKHWKTKITDSIEARMKTLMEKQDEWMQKVMHTIEEKEKERILKEKQWRKEEAARFEREKMFRSSERARIEQQHSALMEALHKLTKNESTTESRIYGSCGEYCNNQDQTVTSWGENETTQLIQLRSSMETRFEKLGEFMEDVLWEEIAITMASLGYNRNALMCKAKWDHISFLLRNKRQKGCSNLCYDHQHNHIFPQANERLIRFNDRQSDHNEMMWNYNEKVKEV